MQETIIAERFKQWTENLNPQEARISIFEHIRDIPYAIIPELREPNLGPKKMLELNRGSCQPKHYLLGIFFSKLNIPVKYATYPFSWTDLAVKYPQVLKAIAGKLPQVFHLACEACIEGKWVLVDATWDVALKKAGFPVNEHWNGVDNTLNAVIPQMEILHENARERWLYETQKRSLFSSKEITLYTEFIENLNRWLEEVRKS